MEPSPSLANEFSVDDFQTIFQNQPKEDVLADNGTTIDFGKTDIYSAKTVDGQDETKANDKKQEEAARPQQVLNKLDFADHAKTMFPKLDSNEDGKLSHKELAKAMLDPSHKGQDAQTVAALYEASKDGNLEDMAESEGSGISKADLDKMDVEAEHGMAAFRSKFASKFTKSHGGEDGRLSKEEITQLLAQDNLSERDQINLKFLKDNYDLIDKDGNGLDAKEIKKYGDDQFNSDGMKLALKAESTIGLVSKEQTSKNSRELYANKDNPIESIQDPEAVKQSGSSCFFEASLLAVAQADPEAVKNMINKNDDGSYTVTFPGDKDNPVTVDAPTEAEMGEYHDSSKAGRWGNILQKAHGKYLQESYFRRHFKDFDGGNIPAEGNYGGEARLGETMKLLTGRDYDRDGFAVTPGLQKTSLDFASSPEELRNKLAESFNGDDKEPVVASTSKPAHVYAITGFDKNGADGGTIEFIDPLGGGKDYMSVKEAIKKFNAIAYSKRSQPMYTS